jgi:chemotaxis protein histidine kinase CheA
MESWDEILTYLRDGYVRDSLERVERMAQQLSRLDAEPGDGELLSELRREFHGLTGSGMSYGFPVLSAIGREGERELSQHLSRGGPTTPEERDRWHGLLSQLSSTLSPFASHRA